MDYVLILYTTSRSVIGSYDKVPADYVSVRKIIVTENKNVFQLEKKLSTTRNAIPSTAYKYRWLY